jgi:hypothetical protein
LEAALCSFLYPFVLPERLVFPEEQEYKNQAAGKEKIGAVIPRIKLQVANMGLDKSL